MGMESRLEGELKSFPLLLRLSRARLTSKRMSVQTASTEKAVVHMDARNSILRQLEAQHTNAYAE